MNCIGPMTPEDDELLAYADGEATPEAAAHISACASCQARVNALRQELAMWQTALHRAGCPSSLELGEHYLRMLPSDREAEVAEHLRYCRACAAEMATLPKFLGRVKESRVETAVTQVASALRTVQAHLKSLNSGTTAPNLALVPRAVRGERGPYIEDTRPVTYNAENVLVSLEFFKEIGAPTRQVIGLVDAADDFVGAEAEVTDDNSAPQRAAIDELGSFSFSGVSVGPHRLRVKLPTSGVQVEIDDLTVK